MTVKVTIENPIDAIVRMRARKTLDGNILILDHPEIDIVVSPKTKKILSLVKENYSDEIYRTHNRLFKYLSNRGIVSGATVRSGNIFGSLEGKLEESIRPDKVDSVQMAIYSIAQFLIEEKPYFKELQDYEKEVEDSLVYPPEDETTRLGKVPHEKRKGGATYPGYNAPIGMYGLFEE